jgi:hypothetical protein
MTTQADPDDYHFVVLNVSINNTPVFVSVVVIFRNISKKKQLEGGCKINQKSAYAIVAIIKKRLSLDSELYTKIVTRNILPDKTLNVVDFNFSFHRHSGKQSSIRIRVMP